MQGFATNAVGNLTEVKLLEFYILVPEKESRITVEILNVTHGADSKMTKQQVKQFLNLAFDMYARGQQPNDQQFDNLWEDFKKGER